MRVGIALTGTVLLFCGVFVLALGLFGGPVAARPLLDPAVSRYIAANEWFWPVAGGVAEIAALSGLVWLAGQSRAVVHRRRPALDGPSRMLARAAAGDLRRDALSLAGVQDVRFRLAGTALQPRLLMSVTCAEDTGLGEVYAALGHGPVERYRAAVDLPGLAVIVRFHLDHRDPRPA